MPWQLDPSHSSIEFAVKHMVLATAKGTFKEYDVKADVDPTNLAASSATVTIDAASLDTNNNDRDTHLRSPDFFDVENYPQITFVTKKIEQRKGDDYEITGDLTIRDITKEVTLKGELNGPAKDPWGNERVGLSADGKINRKDFGLNWNVALEAGGFLVGEDVKLSIEAQLVKAA